MKTIQRTAWFSRWLDRLHDRKAIDKITARIDRLKLGNPGDHKHLGGALSEMRIDHGPGYASTSPSVTRPSSCCSVAETSAARPTISPERAL
jgi:putative component of toxin-antitoxin plasmid stabilization module